MSSRSVKLVEVLPSDYRISGTHAWGFHDRLFSIPWKTGRSWDIHLWREVDILNGMEQRDALLPSVLKHFSA